MFGVNINWSFFAVFVWFYPYMIDWLLLKCVYCFFALSREITRLVICAFYDVPHENCNYWIFLPVQLSWALCLFWLTCTSLVWQFVAHSKCSNSRKSHRRIIHCPHSFCTIRKTQVMAVVRSGMFTSYFCFALWLLSSSTSASFFSFHSAFQLFFSVMQSHDCNWKMKYAVWMCLHCAEIECVWMPGFECMESVWKPHACCGAGGVRCAWKRLVWLTLAPISKTCLPQAAAEPLQLQRW